MELVPKQPRGGPLPPERHDETIDLCKKRSGGHIEHRKNAVSRVSVLPHFFSSKQIYHKGFFPVASHSLICEFSRDKSDICIATALEGRTCRSTSID